MGVWLCELKQLSYIHQIYHGCHVYMWRKHNVLEENQQYTVVKCENRTPTHNNISDDRKRLKR